MLKRKKPPKRGSGRKGRHDEAATELLTTKPVSPRAPTTRGKAMSNKIGKKCSHVHVECGTLILHKL